MTDLPFSPAARTAIAIIIAAPLWLAACRQAPQEHKQPGVPINAASLSITNALTLASKRAEAPTDQDGRAVATPISAADVKGEEGARKVLANWAKALEKGDWTRARAQWGHGGADSGLRPDAYRQIAVAFGRGAVEGGAGSLYYQVPVVVTGTLQNGDPVRLEGPVTLRRVNDVDGASADQLAWHITRSDLKPRN